jgi:hypothetical protein
VIVGVEAAERDDEAVEVVAEDTVIETQKDQDLVRALRQEKFEIRVGQGKPL